MIFIIDINKKTDSRLYRLLSVKKKNGEINRQVAEFDEASLMHKMANGMKLENAEIKGNKIVGTTGSLDRFDGSGGTLVIITEIAYENGKVIGYRAADATGNIRSLKVEKLIEYCNLRSKKGFTPIQNAIFVRETKEMKQHIKPFIANGFVKELMPKPEAKQKYTPKIEEKDKNTKKLEDIFTEQQINELKMGKQEKLNYKIYANPKLSPEQMKEIRKGLKNKVNVRVYLDPAFSADQMAAIRSGLQLGVGYHEIYADPRYDMYQMMEIQLGLMNGADVNKFADPKIPAKEMTTLREMLEYGIWKDEKAVWVSPDKF